MYAAVDLVLNSFYNVFNVHNKMYHSLDKVAQDVTHAADTVCLLNPELRTRLPWVSAAKADEMLYRFTIHFPKQTMPLC